MRKKTGLFCLIVPVFLLYFISEAFLRCAAIANINPDKIRLDNILNDLPESIRDVVSYRIMHTELTNSLAAAGTEDEKIAIMAQLGDYTRDRKEKERIFNLLFDHYPGKPASAVAFTYYLLRKDSSREISVPEFHRYLLQFPQMDRFNIWALALNRLTQLKISDLEKIQFMLPLLDMKPEYRDYSIFYAELVRLGTKCGRSDIANRADALIDESRLCESIAEVQLEQERRKRSTQSGKRDMNKRNL